MTQDIYSLAQDIITSYRDGTNHVDVVEGLTYSMYDQVRETEFLSSSHYMNGDYDEDGQLRPFQDIITRILENQRTAEEIDTSDLKIVSDDPDFYTRAMLLDKYNQDWLYENRLDQKINDAIEARGKYGGVLIKVTEDEDNLGLEVVDWTAFAGDEADLQNGIKVITHFYTPAQLIDEAKKKGWDMAAVQDAIEFYAQANQEDSEYRDQRETTGKYVLVREVTGTLERTYIDDNADEYEYTYQLHYLAGTEFRDSAGRSQAKTLFSAELDQTPYYYLPYKKRGGNAKLLGIGQVERAKHAQVQTNRGAQNWKKALDFASTHVLQSSSKNLAGKNVLSQIKAGTIIKTEDAKPISGVDMSPQALQFLDRYLINWQNQVDAATGTTAIGTGAGEKLPSDMTYRLGAVLDQNAQSPFDLRREEMGIMLNQIYKERVIPYLIRKIKNATALNLKFNPDELQQIDVEIMTKMADDFIIKNYFEGAYNEVALVERFQLMDDDRLSVMQGLQDELKKGKSRRKIVNDMADWREYWSESDGKVYIEVTNERRKKGVILESANNAMLQYLTYKPQFDADPEARKMLNDIVQMAGLRPINFSNTQPVNPVEQQQPDPMQEEKPLAQSAKPK